MNSKDFYGQLPREYLAEFEGMLQRLKQSHLENGCKHNYKCNNLKLTAFRPLKGELFEVGRHIMVIGRAPNGWDRGWMLSEGALIHKEIINSLQSYPMAWAYMQYGKENILKYESEISRYATKDHQKYKRFNGYLMSLSVLWNGRITVDLPFLQVIFK